MTKQPGANSPIWRPDRPPQVRPAIAAALIVAVLMILSELWPLL